MRTKMASRCTMPNLTVTPKDPSILQVSLTVLLEAVVILH